MSNTVKVLTAALGCLALTSCASLPFGDNNNVGFSGVSDETPEYQDRLSRGLYATIGIGPSRMEPDTTQLVNWDPNDRVEPAGQIALGVDLTKHLSLEAHSADLGSAGLSPRGRINYHINGASALIYAGGNRDRYRRQGLTAYGRVGVGALENTAVGDVPFAKVNATHTLVGAGVEYMTPIGVGIRAEGISFDKDARYAQLALMYRMGGKKNPVRPKLAEQVVEQPVVAAAVPEPIAADRCAGLKGALIDLGFETDSAYLDEESQRVLDQVATSLNACSGTSLELTAHTDARGTDEYNIALSERRAQSVVNYLGDRGFTSTNIDIQALGETSPIGDNSTVEGRAANRRVEIIAR